MILLWVADVDKVLKPTAVNVAGRATIRFLLWSAYKGQGLCTACGGPIFLLEPPRSGSSCMPAWPSLRHYQNGGLVSQKCVCKKEARSRRWHGGTAVRTGLVVGAGISEDVE